MVLRRLRQLVRVAAISIQSKNGLEAISLGATMSSLTMEMIVLAGAKRQLLLGLLTETMRAMQDNLSGQVQTISASQLLGTIKITHL